jgi:hypothetical protein
VDLRAIHNGPHILALSWLFMSPSPSVPERRLSSSGPCSPSRSPIKPS